MLIPSEKVKYILKHGRFIKGQVLTYPKQKARGNMSVINQKYIDELAEFEYAFRDGMVFTDEQKALIKAICEQIIALTKE